MALGAFAGVEIAASVNGVPLGDDALAPFWAAAEATGALVFIHPTTRGSSGAGFDDHYLWNLVGNPMETTVAAAHLVLAGRAWSATRACGSCSPTAAARCSRCAGACATAGRTSRRRGRGWASRRTSRCGASTTTRSCSTRTCCARSSRSPAPTACCSAPTTPSTWPTRDPADTVRAAGLDPAAEAAILGGNAARLLGLEVPR